MEINIDRLRAYSHIGVYPDEKVTGQDFFIDVNMKLTNDVSYDSDNLNNTVDYVGVSNLIIDYMNTASCDLIETAVDALTSMILISYELLDEVTVTIHKPNAPVEVEFDDLSASCTKRWVKAYLSLGSNMGDKDGYLNIAIKQLQLEDKIRRVRTSRIITTKPYGNVNQDDFRNMCCELETICTPLELLHICNKIEEENGRVRAEHWGPRTLDIDILLYGDSIINSKQLIVPHIDMHNRRFVLEPLAELAPGAYHPIMRMSVAQMLKGCED